VVVKSTILWDITPSMQPPAFTLVSCRTYFFYPEDGGDMFLRSGGWHSTDCTALYPRRLYSLMEVDCDIEKWVKLGKDRVR
jgi:hypothetical protein